MIYQDRFDESIIDRSVALLFFCSFWRRACNEQHKMRLMISVFRRTHWLVGTIFKWPNIEFEPFNVMNYPIISEIMIILAVWHESFEFANHTKSSHLPFKWLCTLEKKDCSTITDRPITFIKYTQIFTFLIKYAANKNCVWPNGGFQRYLLKKFAYNSRYSKFILLVVMFICKKKEFSVGLWTST